MCVCVSLPPSLPPLGFCLDLLKGGFPDDEDFFADGVDPWDNKEEPAYDNFTLNLDDAVQQDAAAVCALL